MRNLGKEKKAVGKAVKGLVKNAVIGKAVKTVAKKAVGKMKKAC